MGVFNIDYNSYLESTYNKNKMKQNKEQDIDIVAYLCEKQNGYIKDLEKEFSPNKVRELEVMGYIVSAPSSDPSGTWRVSKRVVQLNQMMNRRSSLYERIKDFFYIHILKVDFGI